MEKARRAKKGIYLLSQRQKCGRAGTLENTILLLPQCFHTGRKNTKDRPEAAFKFLT